MEPAESALPLRVRPFWEAVDAGILLLRRWAAPLLLFYALPTVLVAALAAWLWGTDLPWLPVVLLWWLRPLGDRLILGWAGELFFRPARWSVLAWKTLRSLDGSFWADLTYRRFSPWAVFLAPVSFLEGGDRAQRRRRRRWLGAGLGGPLALLALGTLVVEGAVAGSLWTTSVVLLSPGLWGASAGFEGTLEGFWWTVLAAAVQLLVQPVYTLSCFGLYVGTRTRKEGWDLSLAFRSLRASLKNRGPALAVLVTVFLGWAAPEKVHAAFVPPQAGAVVPQAQQWEEVVADPSFGRKESSWALRWKQAPEKAPRPEEPTPGPWGSFSAELLRGGALSVGGLVLAALVVYGIGSAWGRRPRTKAAAVRNLREVPSAADWGAEVRNLWSAGRPREALSRLYQAALGLAVRVHRLPVPPAATEGECLRLLAGHSDPGFASAVAGLVSLWTELAWAGRLPSQERFLGAVAALEATVQEGSR